MIEVHLLQVGWGDEDCSKIQVPIFSKYF